MNRRYCKGDIASFSDQTVFFDANVLLYLFYPAYSKNHWVPKYSSIFGALMRDKINIVVDFMVLSEFVNRILRESYKDRCRKKKVSQQKYSYKKFRNSRVCIKLENSIYDWIRNDILKVCSIYSYSISESDVQSILTVSELDFQDKLIEKVCRDNDFILCTNDSDFKNSDIDILSAHPDLS